MRHHLCHRLHLLQIQIRLETLKKINLTSRLRQHQEEEEKQVKDEVGEEQDVDSDLNSFDLQILETIVETCFDGWV